MKNILELFNKILLIIILAFTILSQNLFSDDNWKMDLIGTYDWFYEIKIGDGRNDGINRLYSATYDGHLLEWTYNTTTYEWDMVNCGGVPGANPSGNTRIISIWIEEGRNDGLNRIYGAAVDGNNYEFSYNTSSNDWEMNSFGSNSFQTGVVVGDSRNDGINRVITSGASVQVKDYTWDNNSWSSINVSNSSLDIWPSFIGEGRNDDLNRIYAPDWSQNYLREYTWNGSSYDQNQISTDKSSVKAIVGSGRNDDIYRVYTAEWYGHITEFSWNGSEWDQNDIMEGQGANHSRYGLCFGKTHADDINRLYSVAQLGGLREHTYEEGEWSDETIDAISGATADLTVGDGRNDNINRVYVAGANGNLYEYTHSDFDNLHMLSDLPDILVTNESYITNLNDYFAHDLGEDIEYSIVEVSNTDVASVEITNSNLTVTNLIGEGETFVKLKISSGLENIINEFEVKCTEPYLKAGFGHSYNFTGDDYVNLGNSSALNDFEILTFQSWIKFDTLDIDQGIVNKSQSTSTGLYVKLNSNNKIKFFIRTEENTNRKLYSNLIFEENLWYHLSCVYDGYSVKLYINGVLDKIVSYDDYSPINSSEELDLKFATFLNDNLIGEIDDTRIWNIALDENEIIESMGNKLTGNEDNLICYIDYDEGYGFNLNNLATNENALIFNYNNENWKFSDVIVTYKIDKDESTLSGILPSNNSETVQYVITENNCINGDLVLIDENTGEFNYTLNIHEVGEDTFSYKVRTDSYESEEINGVIKITIPVDIDENYELSIMNYELKQNYPNPFNPLTRINYELRITNYELAEIVVFNVTGQQVWSSPITDHSLRVTDSILFDGSSFNSGIYYYSLVVDGKAMSTKKMILIK